MKRKPFPLSFNSHCSTEAVLRERKVEIKDLESEVSYLKKRIKVSFEVLYYFCNW